MFKRRNFSRTPTILDSNGVELERFVLSKDQSQVAPMANEENAIPTESGSRVPERQVTVEDVLQSFLQYAVTEGIHVMMVLKTLRNPLI